MDETSEILLRCCALRGIQSQLFHRTLKEFDWFVTTLMFRENDEYDKYREMVFPLGRNEEIPLRYAKAFHAYCTDIYKEGD